MLIAFTYFLTVVSMSIVVTYCINDSFDNKQLDDLG